MGAFTKFVKNNKTCSTAEPRFDPATLAAALTIKPTDARDHDLKTSFFLLTEVAKQARGATASPTSPLPRECIGEVAEQVATAAATITASSSATWIITQSPLVRTAAGVSVQIDELLAALLDGLEWVLRCTMKPTHAPVFFPPLAQRALVQGSLMHALQAAWLDCVVHGFLPEVGLTNIVLKSPDTIDYQRAVSVTRRRNIERAQLTEAMLLWRNESSEAKRQRCGISLVESVSGEGRIRLTMGSSTSTLDRCAMALLQHELLREADHAGYLTRSLPLLGGVQLEQLVLAWRVVQSLACAIVLRPYPQGAVVSATEFRSPSIAADDLIDGVSVALSVTKSTAEALINALTFHAYDFETVWTQPLIRSGNDYLVIAGSAVAPQLQQVYEGWIVGGGLSLADKGLPYEASARALLRTWAGSGPLAGHFWMPSMPVSFHDAKTGKTHDVDGLLVIGGTAVLLEIKCVIWPESAHQYANYRTQVLTGIDQLRERLEAIQRHPNGLVSQWPNDGTTRPAAINRVIGCVVTSSYIYSGFPIENIAVVDLPIWRDFLTNIFPTSSEVKLYASARDAELMLEEYLLDPPQLAASKSVVSKVQMTFPYATSHGQLVHEVHQAG